MTTQKPVATIKVQVSDDELTDSEWEWTRGCFIDELSHELETTGTKLDNNNRLATARPYVDQVRELIYRIPIWKPSPPFVIHYSWLSKEMKQKYDDFKKFSYKHEFETALLDAVGRLFENENSEYYHSSVKQFLQVKVIW
jgi:hypothetical protein